MDPITPRERIELAELAGLNEQYLYQCLTGRRDMDAIVASKLEVKTSGRIRRWHVRKDWAAVWPELVGAPDAPKPDTTEPQAA